MSEICPSRILTNSVRSPVLAAAPMLHIFKATQCTDNKTTN